jgi:hypothetical protein
VRILAPVVLFAPTLLGCPNTDAAVFVDASVTSPSLTLGKIPPLVSGITSGGFTLDLHLGARASGPSTSTLDAFSVMDSSHTNTLVPSLAVMASGGGYATGSTVVEPNSDNITSFTIPMKQLMPSDLTALCTAGDVVIAGGVTDSLMGGTTPTPAYSPPFKPTGCP